MAFKFNPLTGTFDIDTDTVGGAPSDATYIVQTADATLTNEQVLADLATGIVKNTTTTGVLSIAIDGTDYVSPTAGDNTYLRLDCTNDPMTGLDLNLGTADLTTKGDIWVYDGAGLGYISINHNGTDGILLTNVGSINLDPDSNLNILLPDNAGASKLSIQDSDLAEVASIDSNGVITGVTLTDGTFSVTGGAITGATNTDWDAAYTHIGESGASHTYIDQSVISGSTPTFTATNITGVPAANILAGTFGTGAYVFDNTVSGITTLTATSITDGTASLSGGALTGLTTPLTFGQGGTGLATWTQYLIPYADTTTSIGQIAIGTATHVLTSNGVGVAPSFQAASGGGYTNLTQFVDQTAWRVFYSNTDGDVTELALGGDGTYLMSNGAAVAPTFETAPAAGDVTAGANIANNAIVLGDGGAKGVQDSGVLIDDDDDMSGLNSLGIDDGNDNVLMGQSFSTGVTSGTANVGIGVASLRVVSEGLSNVGIGDKALFDLTTGDYNVAIGRRSLYNVIDGDYNAGIGYNTLYYLKDGDSNLGIGANSLFNLIYGSSNVAMGPSALAALKYGGNNTAVGLAAAQQMTPTSGTITSFEDYSGTVAGTVKANSTAHGLVNGNSITIVGTVNYNAKETITKIDDNSFYFTATWVESETGAWYKQTEATENTIIGRSAGNSLITGSYNVLIGDSAGSNMDADGSNQLWIDNTGGATPLIYGEFDTENIMLGGTSPTARLHLPAGTTTASSAPLKFTAGTALTTAETGAVEFHNDRFYISNVACRKAIDRTSDVITATTTVENTTTETTIYTSTIAANALKVGNTIKQLTMGTLTTASAADVVTGRVKVGGATIATLTSGGTGTHTDQPWHFDVRFTQREVGATAEIAYHIDLELDGSTSVDGQTDIDTTAQADLTVTVQWNNAKAGNILDINQGITEYKN